jgi:hypothetical protein
MNVQLPEDLCCVEQVVLLEDPDSVSPSPFTPRWSDILLSVPSQERQVEYKRDPVPIDKEQEGQESVNGGLGDDVGVQAVAEVNRVDVITGAKLACACFWARLANSSFVKLFRAAAAGELGCTHHSRSLYIMVKKTCRNRLTAFINTARRYNHASPVIVRASCAAWHEDR